MAVNQTDSLPKILSAIVYYCVVMLLVIILNIWHWTLTLNSSQQSLNHNVVFLSVAPTQAYNEEPAYSNNNNDAYGNNNAYSNTDTYSNTDSYSNTGY